MNELDCKHSSDPKQVISTCLGTRAQVANTLSKLSGIFGVRAKTLNAPFVQIFCLLGFPTKTDYIRFNVSGYHPF